MKETIYKILDKKWKNVVMDGTKPPVKSCLRKQLKRLITTNEPNDATTTKLYEPLVMVFYFEQGDISIEPPRRSITRKINEDTIYNLEELYDQPLSDQSLNDKMKTITLINKSPPLNASTPSKVNEQIIIDKSPFENDKASNILISLTNHDLIISDKSPSKDNSPTTNISSSDNLFMNDITVEDNDPRNDLQDYLSKLRQENENMMKNYDVKIESYQKKINKGNEALKKMNYELQKMSCELQKTISEKENKHQEFLNLLNEHTRLLKTNNFNGKRQKKSIKRMTNGIGGGGK